MSVKRRLFISNMLMLVLPIVIMILTIIGVMLIYTGMTGIREAPPLKFGDVFFKRMEVVEKLAGERNAGMEWDQIKAEIDQFNQEYQKLGLHLSLHRGEKLVHPSSLPADSLVETGGFQEEHFILVTDRLAMYKFQVEDHTLILSDTNFTINSRDEFQSRIYGGIVMLIVLIIIVVATNRILMKFVFRSIMNPIQILVHGVHQLRDGNLMYRIAYDKQDEFKVVCAEFNEMAERLSTLVDERQKDEVNRRELIAGISHDLRTPLTSIKAYLEGIEKGVASTPQMQQKYFKTIKNKTESLEHIINQLFLFSKLDIGEFPLHLERINIGEELRKTMASFALEYEPKGLVIREENRMLHAELFIDVVQFRNVIQNIIENSLKYKNKERAEIRMGIQEKEDYVEIGLTDDGPGVSEEELDHLFDVFYRSDASRKSPELGSGLGLAISRKVIERFGGHIRAEIAASGGLSIIMILPKYQSIKGDIDEKNTDH